MDIVRGRAGASEQRTANVTGTSWADPVLSSEHGVNISHVFFGPASRTYWHVHEYGQVLQVTSGNGWVVARDGSGGRLAVGDTVFIPPGEDHWHGADADSFLVHTSISLGGIEWRGEVTDEEYAAALRA